MRFLIILFWLFFSMGFAQNTTRVLSGTTVHLATEKGVYRNHELIHWWVKAQANTPIALHWADQRQQVFTNAYGVARGTLRVPDFATGINVPFELCLKTQCANFQSLEIRAYRKPDVQLYFANLPQKVQTGTVLQPRLEVQRLFRGDNTNLRVRWLVLNQKRQVLRQGAIAMQDNVSVPLELTASTGTLHWEAYLEPIREFVREPYQINYWQDNPTLAIPLRQTVQVGSGLPVVQASSPNLQIELKTMPKLRLNQASQLEIRVTDKAGRGIQSDLTLAMVDETVHLLSDPNPVLLPNTDETIVQNTTDTAFWKSLQTNANGVAVISFIAPERAGTWRITARVVTKNGTIANQITRVQTQRSLRLEPSAATHMVLGDQLEMRVGIQNTSAEVVTGELRWQGGQLGEQRWAVTLEPNSRMVKTWKLEPEMYGSFETTLTFRNATENTENKATFEVIAPYQNDVLTLTSRDQTIVPIEAKPNAVAGSAKLQLELLEPLLQKQQQLHLQPSSQTDTCPSSQMSLLFTHVLLLESNAYYKLSPEQIQNSQTLIPKTIAKLEQMQNPDGYWFYCQADDEQIIWSVNTTTNVVSALLRAKKQGFAIPKTMLEKSLSWIAKEVQNTEQPLISRAYLARVQTEAGQSNLEILQDLSTNNDPLVLANIAMAYINLRLETQARSILQRIFEQRQEQPNTVFWGEEGDYLRPTAFTLELLAQLEPNNPLIAKAIVFLQKQTSIAILRAALMLERQANGNSRQAMQVVMNGLALLQNQDGTWTIPKLELKNSLELRNYQGTYTATIRYQYLDRAYTPIQRGIKIERRFEKLVLQDGIYQPKPLFSGTQQLEPLHIGDLVLLHLSGEAKNDVRIDQPMPPAFVIQPITEQRIAGIQQEDILDYIGVRRVEAIRYQLIALANHSLESVQTSNSLTVYSGGLNSEYKPISILFRIVQAGQMLILPTSCEVQEFTAFASTEATVITVEGER
jgi:hypothetical protein